VVVVLDASVLIAHLDGRDAHHPRAVELLLAAQHSAFVASVVTVAEVLVGPVKAGAGTTAVAALRALRLVRAPLASDAAEKLAGLRAKTGLKLPDCCVLLAALDVDATGILTFDDRLGRAAVAAGFALRPG
jgi:predicted nucleic acid-binding protein